MMSSDMDLIMAARGDEQNELFHKKLTGDDIGHRCYIPKDHEEKFLSPDFGFHPNNKDGILTVEVTFYDIKEKKPWKVLFRRGAGQRSYLTQWKAFAEKKELRVGDVITFYKLKIEKGTFLLVGIGREGYIFGEDFTRTGH